MSLLRLGIFVCSIVYHCMCNLDMKQNLLGKVFLKMNHRLRGTMFLFTCTSFIYTDLKYRKKFDGMTIKINFDLVYSVVGGKWMAKWEI